jgi:hypothetical protein
LQLEAGSATVKFEKTSRGTRIFLPDTIRPQLARKKAVKRKVTPDGLRTPGVVQAARQAGVSTLCFVNMVFASMGCVIIPLPYRFQFQTVPSIIVVPKLPAPFRDVKEGQNNHGWTITWPTAIRI